jgi:hypothetical protein
VIFFEMSESVTRKEQIVRMANKTNDRRLLEIAGMVFLGVILGAAGMACSEDSTVESAEQEQAASTTEDLGSLGANCEVVQGRDGRYRETGECVSWDSTTFTCLGKRPSSSCQSGRLATTVKQKCSLEHVDSIGCH